MNCSRRYSHLLYPFSLAKMLRKQYREQCYKSCVLSDRVTESKRYYPSVLLLEKWHDHGWLPTLLPLEVWKRDYQMIWLLCQEAALTWTSRPWFAETMMFYLHLSLSLHPSKMHTSDAKPSSTQFNLIFPRDRSMVYLHEPTAFSIWSQVALDARDGSRWCICICTARTLSHPWISLVFSECRLGLLLVWVLVHWDTARVLWRCGNR